MYTALGFSTVSPSCLILNMFTIEIDYRASHGYLQILFMSYLEQKVFIL